MGNYPRHRGVGWPSTFAVCGHRMVGTVLSLLQPAVPGTWSVSSERWCQLNMDDNGTILSANNDLQAVRLESLLGNLVRTKGG